MRFQKMLAVGACAAVAVCVPAAGAQARQVHGHYLTVNDTRIWVSGREVRREIPRPTDRQLMRYNVLTMGNRKAGRGWRHLTPTEIDVVSEGSDQDHPWERCVIHYGPSTTFVDCPDWTVITS